MLNVYFVFEDPAGSFDPNIATNHVFLIFGNRILIQVVKSDQRLRPVLQNPSAEPCGR